MKQLFKFMVVWLFLSFTNVYAYELICDDGTYGFQDYFNCRVTGPANIEFTSITGSITNDDYVSCQIAEKDQKLRYVTEDDRRFDLKGTAASENFVTYKCQVVARPASDMTSQAIINNFSYALTSGGTESNIVLRSNFINLKKYDGPTTTTQSSGKNRDTSNGDALLRGLSADNLNITFSKFITEYSAEVVYEVESLNITALPANENASVTITGDTNLRVGDNTIDISVTSPDNSHTTVYTLYIKRLARGEAIYYPEDDASLFSLSIPGYNIAFDPLVYDYAIHLTRDVDAVEVIPAAKVETAMVDVSRTTDLKNGDIITVTVTSESAVNSQKYRIKITKDAPKKDYSMYFILGGIGVLFIGLIFLFIHSSRKKKDSGTDLRKSNRKINRGAKFDANAVPDTNVQAGNELANVNPNPNVITENANVATPIATTNVDMNLNKVTPMNSTLILDNAPLVAKQNVESVPSGNVNPSVAPVNPNSQVIPNSQGVNPQGVNPQNGNNVASPLVAPNTNVQVNANQVNANNDVNRQV